MKTRPTRVSALIGLLLISAPMQAERPDWLQPSQDPAALSAVASLSPEEQSFHNGVSPGDVFTVSGQPLLCSSGLGSAGECAGVISCQSEPAPGRTWVQFTPYMWGTQVNGDLTVEGLTAPLNLDLSDLWTLLENGEVRGAFMGHLEFGRDHWALFVNGDIVSMDPSAQVRRATLETGLTMTMLELGGAVDIFNANESDPVNSPLRVQVLGGTRYYAMDASAILSLPNINPVIEIDQGAQWVDLFFGGRAMATITPGVGAFVRGDVGGFGIGSSSSHAWNFVSGLNLDCICGSHLILAYRVFDIDQSLNGGNGAPQGFGFDGMIHGPVMGMMFQF